MNWQHFKGWNTVNSNTAYTDIVLSATTGTTYASNPQINVYSDDPLTSTSYTNYSLGYVLTSDATGQYVTNGLKFLSTSGSSSGVLIQGGEITTNLNESGKLNSSLTLIGPTGGDEIFGNLTFFNTATLLYDKNKIAVHAPEIFLQESTNHYSFTLNSTGHAKFTTDVTATYFNTTSDARAKTNLCEAHYSALDIVNNLKTYTYNYKDSNEQSYGILAQDMLDYSINGFSFIDNTAATGVDGDYMKVKESKLVYLLLEAVKEQQKEIEELKRQLKK